MAELKPYEVLLSDPLSQETRRQRRNLLGALFIAYLIATAGIVPTEIPFFGVDLKPSDQESFVFALAVVLIYFGLAFCVYVLMDLPRWVLRFRNARFAAIKRREEASAEHAAAAKDMTRKEALSFGSAKVLAVVRAIWEVLVPIAAFAYVLTRLIGVEVGPEAQG